MLFKQSLKIIHFNLNTFIKTVKTGRTEPELSQTVPWSSHKARFYLNPADEQQGCSSAEQRRTQQPFEPQNPRLLPFPALNKSFRVPSLLGLSSV